MRYAALRDKQFPLKNIKNFRTRFGGGTAGRSIAINHFSYQNTNSNSKGRPTRYLEHESASRIKKQRSPCNLLNYSFAPFANVARIKRVNFEIQNETPASVRSWSLNKDLRGFQPRVCRQLIRKHLVRLEDKSTLHWEMLSWVITRFF